MEKVVGARVLLRPSVKKLGLVLEGVLFGHNFDNVNFVNYHFLFSIL